jgi:hypothetical protein
METSPRLLTHSNLQRLFDEIGALYKPIRRQQLAGHFAAVLKRLIPGDFYGMSVVVGPKSGARRETILHPVPSHWESLAETFTRQYTKFPLRSIRESGNLYQPLAVSDIASRQKVESLDLYHDYYRFSVLPMI